MNDSSALKERALALLLAIDGIRDADDENPTRMFDSIVHTLRTTFAADACAIALLAETSEDIEWIAAQGMVEMEAIELCRAALVHETPRAIESRWRYTLGNRLTLKRLPLGGLFLARESRPFEAEEIELLAMGEKQIDSAIVQAHTYWKLMQRTRELEAIYTIDRLRDEINSESALLQAFTSILIEQFRAQLSILIINDGDWSTVGMAETCELPPDALRAIRQRADDLQFPQLIPSPTSLTTAEGEHLFLLAAPFIVGSARIGAVVVGRRTLFSVDDHRLLYAITSQMDSALNQFRLIEQLARCRQA